MPFQETNIKGLWVFEPRIFEDERGHFFESFNQRDFALATGFDKNFVQDNQSLSKYGVMRGLHFQLPPHEQSKLVRVISGQVLDVAVDIRRNSPTYKQYYGIKLSAENRKQLFIPVGFAHGFVVLSQSAEVLYKCDNYYAPASESGILYNDSELKIDWLVPKKDLIISAKDEVLKTLLQANFNF